METSIILLSYNHWELTHARLAELAQYMPWEDCELIVFDNGSTDEDCFLGITWWEKYFKKPLKYFRVPENLGFSGGFNEAITHATGRKLLLLSNDVRIMKPSFIDTVGQVLTNCDTILAGGRVINWDTGWNKFVIKGKTYVIPYCEGYALAITASAWVKLGGFDPRFNPHDYEDIDLSMTALSKGFSLLPLGEHDYIHFGGQTITSQDRPKITIEHQKIFLDKWKDTIPTLLKERF